jgi:hypothetical protein
LYLIVFDWPKDGSLRLEMTSRVTHATLLKDGTAVAMKQGEGCIELTLPAKAPSKYASAIVVEFEGELRACRAE